MASMPNIPKTMKAIRLHEYGGNYQFHDDVPVPSDLDDDDVLIAIKSAGFCHTEMLVRDGIYKAKQLPIIPSHEPSGIIVAMGKNVSNEFKIGDRVGALSWNHTCGKCADCLNDKPYYCDEYNGTGLSIDGAFAEYQTADSRWLVPLPDEVSCEQGAPLMCAGATAFYAIEMCALKKGEILGIVGIGALGHLAVQFAKCMELKVVAIDNRSEPLELIQKLKYPPDLTIDSSKIDAINANTQIDTLHSTTKNNYPGVDATLVLTGAIPAYKYALAITKKHGTMMAVGLPSVEQLPIDLHDLIGRDITIKGSMLASIESARRMVKFVAQYGIKSEVKTYSLEEVPTKLWDDFHSPNMKGKLVVNVSTEVYL
jgi:D-arabinose 1-dehydrogenase-like Zn-dependent alcohol dehydrogenase